MACGCGKRNRTAPWRPAASQRPEAQAPEGATHRIVSRAERKVELDNASRPPRARQPQG